jgi:hypothetical protein
LLVAKKLSSAGRWLLDSGIQEPSGGFARFYQAELEKNKAVSTEITGYVTSALVYLFDITKDEAYLACARKAARFLMDAWDAELQTFPFEHPSPSSESDHHSYFFDCGIIIRGLLAVWRETQEDELLEISGAAARGMVADFHSGQDYHPILALPNKEPLPRTDQWSRGPGCYQLKSAMAWWDVAEITGETPLTDAYLEMMQAALATYSTFLDGVSDRHRVMDRLHPYCYFLEGLLPVLDRKECVDAYVTGLGDISRTLRDIAPNFARSDVYAQLLRARIYGAAIIPEARNPFDTVAAQEEAEALSAFQAISDDPRVDGGFSFGRRDGEMSPHINPVSTVFGLQALEMWQEHQAIGNKRPCPRNLI